MVRFRSYPGVELVTGSLFLDPAGRRAGRRRRCPAFTPVVLRATRACGIRPTRRPSRRSSRSIAGDGVHGRRLRGLVVVWWRAGLRIDEALSLREADLDRRRGSLLVRRGKGGRRREVGMDDWGWQELEPWLIARVALPIGPLLCVINGRTRGRPGPPVGPGPSSDAPPRGPASADASRPTSCGTHTRSRWPVKACR
jgi:hypothetical protein